MTLKKFNVCRTDSEIGDVYNTTLVTLYYLSDNAESWSQSFAGSVYEDQHASC